VKAQTQTRILEELASESRRTDFSAVVSEHAPRASDYTDPAIFDDELAAVFGAAWLPIGRAEELALPGRFLAATIGRDPILVTRAEDGALHAFHNVCQHRGAQIVRTDRGQASELRCPYHGFVYELDGRLRSAPQPASFGAALDVKSCRLPQVHVEVFAGWVWINLSQRTAPLRDFLGADLLDEWSHWPFADVELKDRRIVDGAFNWKIGVEAFLEPLHVPAIHARTVHPLVDIRAQSMQALGPHSRMSIAFRARNAFELTGPMGRDAHEHGVVNFAALNEVQRTTNLSYLVFPATVLNLLPNHFTLYQLQPVDAGHSRMLYELYALPAADARQREYYDSLEAGYATIFDEDLDNLAWIQKGVGDSTFAGPRLSYHERRIAQFHARLSEWRAAHARAAAR
jgi:phenylpropionate dioxygenase-like ring-hydroxylating dioxygenase large terminal subunit